MRCAGVILLDKSKKFVVIVQTHRGNYGFPKGKSKKGETLIETAKRECFEESGIKIDDSDIICSFDETKPGRNPSIRYYTCIKECAVVAAKNPEELKSVEWMSVEQALLLDKLSEERKSILRQAVNEAKSGESVRGRSNCS